MTEKPLNHYLKAFEKAEELRVYLASVEDFEKYCQGCEFLAKTEQLSGAFCKRVYCKAAKCVK
ncbi:MAG: hypothetical protein ACPLZY_03865 [Candidatus Norongarragalinales archaeon]